MNNRLFLAQCGRDLGIFDTSKGDFTTPSSISRQRTCQEWIGKPDDPERHLGLASMTQINPQASAGTRCYRFQGGNYLINAGPLADRTVPAIRSDFANSAPG
jgi:hypothetical protein